MVQKVDMQRSFHSTHHHYESCRSWCSRQRHFNAGACLLRSNHRAGYFRETFDHEAFDSHADYFYYNDCQLEEALMLPFRQVWNKWCRSSLQSSLIHTMYLKISAGLSLGSCHILYELYPGRQQVTDFYTVMLQAYAFFTVMNFSVCQCCDEFLVNLRIDNRSFLAFVVRTTWQNIQKRSKEASASWFATTYITNLCKTSVRRTVMSKPSLARAAAISLGLFSATTTM